MDRLRTLVVGPGGVIGRALDGLAISQEWERDPDRGLALLVHGAVDIGVVVNELGEGRTGIELVREAIRRGCTVPLVIVGSEPGGIESEAALLAGAMVCVRCPGPELGWGIAFAAHATQVRRALLGDRRAASRSEMDGAEACNDVLAAIEQDVQALSRCVPETGLGREIEGRLRAFRETVDALTRGIEMKPLLARSSSGRLLAPTATPSLAEARRADDVARPDPS